MASISTDKKKNRTIQFVAADKKRRSVRLGKMPLKDVREIKTKIVSLNSAVIAKIGWDNETSEWVGGLEDWLYERLEAVGLVPKRNKADASLSELGAFLDRYLARRTNVAESTRFHLVQASNKLKEFFGTRRQMSEITALEAEEFRMHLEKTLGPNTVRRMVSRARQFFKAAVGDRRIVENPFGELKDLTVRSVKERQAFITREQTDKLLDAAPDAEWRAIIVLARFGGLRIPSELIHLRWTDIDWTKDVMTIHSPKTKKCGKGTRIVPLFPELKPWLREAWNTAMAADGTLPEFVISLCRSPKSKKAKRSGRVNLRTRFEKIIRRAGLEPWPKLFVNLRASRATELVERFPSHVAAEFLGHTEAVANEHYRQTTAEHYRRAVNELTGAVSECQKQAVRNPVQYAAAHRSFEPHAVLFGKQKSPEITGEAVIPGILVNCLAPRQGLEPWT
jgi:integrase